jgi:hypothetical protein
MRVAYVTGGARRPEGAIVVAELSRWLPFPARRLFVVFDVPSRRVRGEHAHRQISQFLVCLCRECSLLPDDGSRRMEVVLDSPTRGVLVPPRVWAAQYRFSAAMLLVVASEPYDPMTIYVRDMTSSARWSRAPDPPRSVSRR